MANNECFYRYSNRAKLILVQDNDETFIPPRLIENFETRERVVSFLSKADYFEHKNSFKIFHDAYLDNKFSETKPNLLSSYLETIYARNKVDDESSIYFPQVLFGKPDLIDLIFEQIGRINIKLENEREQTDVYLYNPGEY